jgi:hypothetical protein
MNQRKHLLWIMMVMLPFLGYGQDRLFVEAESFEDIGGWVIDQQSFDVLFSSYLMAHGMGRPVEDAQTTLEFLRRGKLPCLGEDQGLGTFPTGPGEFELSH